MTVEVFISILFTVSLVNGLVTQAVKKIFDDMEWVYCSNILAGIVSVVISGFVCYAHAMFSNVIFNEVIAITYIALIVMSWVCAMVGYDKVVQTVKQIAEMWKI